MNAEQIADHRKAVDLLAKRARSLNDKHREHKQVGASAVGLVNQLFIRYSSLVRKLEREQTDE